MPEAVAAREAARRSRNGVRRAATHAARAPRRWRARSLASAVLAGACATGRLAWPPAGALAAGSVAAAPLPQAPIPAPGMSLPGFHAPPPSTSNGTVASGAVRTQPARMPFYVATKGKVTIYVLGTLHVGDPADYPANQPFRRPILAALAASPTLALELSPDDLLESQDDVSKYGVCNYACLPRLLPPPLWQKLANRLRGNPAALAGIRNMRPWLASLVVETYDSLSAGLQTEYGTEAQLQNVFLRKKGGKVVGLETLAEQMRAFTGLTLAQQRRCSRRTWCRRPRRTRPTCARCIASGASATRTRSPPGRTRRRSGSHARGRSPIRSTTRSSMSATAASSRG